MHGEYAILSSADSSFQDNSFRNTISAKQSGSKSGLIWVQAVCKDYQQATLSGQELNICCYLTEHEYVFRKDGSS